MEKRSIAREANLRKALEIQSTLVRRFPRNFSYQFEMAIADESLAGLFQEQGRLPEARSAQQDAITSFKEIMQNDPKAGPIRGVLAHNYANLSDLLRRMGEEQAAAEATRQAEALRPSDNGAIFVCHCWLVQQCGQLARPAVLT